MKIGRPCWKRFSSGAAFVDDVLLNKADIIERCLKRVREMYEGHESEFEHDFQRQDAIVLNLQRACQAAISGGMHLVRSLHLGIPQQSRDAFVLLEKAGVLDRELSGQMQAMVGFRNIAIHQYQELDLAILREIIEHRLDDLHRFARLLVQKAQAS